MIQYDSTHYLCKIMYTLFGMYTHMHIVYIYVDIVGGEVYSMIQGNFWSVVTTH